VPVAENSIKQLACERRRISEKQQPKIHLRSQAIKQHHYKRSGIAWSYEFISLLLYLTFHQINPLLPSSPLPRLKSYCDINFHKPNTCTVNCCCRLIGCFGNAFALVFKDLPSRESSWASFLHPLHKLKHIYCQVLINGFPLPWGEPRPLSRDYTSRIPT